MEYNLHRDFNASFAIDFKRYTSTDDLKDAVDRYVTSQGNQAGLQNLAEILYNMAFNYTPSIAHDLMPQIMGIVKQNGSQAGMHNLAEILYNMAYNYTPEIADDLMPDIIGVVKQNGSQAGMQGVKPVLNAIFEEALTGDALAEAKGLVEKFVEQNDSQTGLPILVEVDGEMQSYTFGQFLKDSITVLDA